MQFERVWCMANRYTFAMKPIRELLQQEMADGALWIDPFAGRNSPAQIRNDIAPDSNAEHHMDALDFLRQCSPIVANVGVLFDPPYSVEQAKRKYKYKYGGNVGFEMYLNDCKNEIARIVPVGGKVITFGWNSAGMGMKRGFHLVSGLLVCHGGGGHKDTIVTVEVKQ